MKKLNGTNVVVMTNDVFDAGIVTMTVRLGKCVLCLLQILICFFRFLFGMCLDLLGGKLYTVLNRFLRGF